MAIFNNLDTGQFSLNQGPSGGQEGGSILVEGAGYVSWSRGGKEAKRSTIINVQAPFGIGGAAAGSRQAVRYAVQQLVEMSLNPDMQPVYIQWESGHGNIVASAYDGWYRLDDVTPIDFTFNSFVPCQVTATRLSVPPPLGIELAHAGGAIPSNFSQIGTAKHILGAPLNSGFLQGTATRLSGEGGVNYTGNPVSPTPIALSGNRSDWFKGGVRIFDTLNTALHGVPLATTMTLWHSLGTEAGTDNSIAYWTQTTGAWTYAAHLATSPSLANTAIAALTGGHPDWWDGVFTARVKCPTNATAYLAIHATGGFANCIDISLSAGSSPGMEKRPSGGYTGLGNVGGTGAVAGTFYWLRISCTGTLYTFSWYDDSAGAIGSLRGTQTVSITDGSLQAGAICLLGYNPSATPETVSFGGAFANVLTVRGPVPTNGGGVAWTPGQGTGESAFCWSRSSAYTGARSLSIFNAAAGGQGFWSLGTVPLATDGATYFLTAKLRGSGGTPTNFYLAFHNLTPANAAADGNWQSFVSANDTWTAGGGWGKQIACIAYGTGTYYFDDVQLLGGGAGPQAVCIEGFEGPYNGNWVEVFDTAHNFVGDCVLANGLTLLFFAVGRGDIGVHYLWNLALESAGWQLAGTPLYYDNANAPGVTNGISLKRVGPSESRVVITAGTANGHIADIRFRLKRGHWTVYLTLKPRTQAATNPRSLAFSVIPGNPRIMYNAGSAGDPSRAEGLGTPTDYGFMGTFNVVGAAAPIIFGWLLPNQAASNLGWSDGFAQIAPGDTTSLAINAEREVGFFAVHYGAFGIYSPNNLQVEAESGSLGTGWSSFNDGGTQAAKCASGTGIGGTVDQVPGDVRRTAGLYRAYFRVRVASAASGTLQMSLNVYDTTTSTVLVTTGGVAPNAFLTTYAWYSPGTFTIVEGHLIHGYAQVVNNPTNTDWFIDEVIVVPLELFSAGRDSESGPRDLWKSFVYDADAVLVTQ